MHFTRGSRLIWVCLCWVGLLSPLAQADSQNHIRHVGLKKQSDGAVVEIVGEQAPNFTTFKQDSPRRVIVDIAECRLSGVPAWSRGNSELVEGIAVRQIGKMPDSVVRVMISLTSEAEYRVSVRGTTLFVYLTPGTGGLLVSAGVPLGPDGSGALEANKDGGFDTQQLTNEINLAGSASSSEMSAHDRALEGALSDGSQNRTDGKQEVKRLAHPLDVKEVVSSRSVTSPEARPVVDSSALFVNQAEAKLKPERQDKPPQPARPVLIAKANNDQKVLPSSEEAGDEILVEKKPEEEISLQPVQPVLIAKANNEQETQPNSEETVDEIEMQNKPEEEVEIVEPPTREEVAPSSDIVKERQITQIEERVEISSALRHMTWMGFQQTSEFSRVFVKTNAPVTYRVNEEGENLIVLELDNTVIPLKNNRRFLDTHFFDSSVAMIVPREVGGVGQSVRIEIQLKQRVPFQTGREENMVYVNFERPK